MKISGWPVDFVLDPGIPEDEIQARDGDIITGRIVNISSSKPLLVLELNENVESSLPILYPQPTNPCPRCWRHFHG